MIFSPDTEAALDFFDEYFKGSMRNRADIGAILEIGAVKSMSIIINQLITEGKIVWNLYRKIETIEYGTDSITEEFEKHLDFMSRNLLVIFSEYEDEVIKKNLGEKYIDTNDINRLNLIDLAHDLALIKDLQTKNREGSLFDNSEPLS